MAGAAGGDAMMIAPPFVIGDKEVEFIVNTARAALDEVYPTMTS
jgi:adenosylmethionine-8-amino-7-oxononanoate aminotransferase